MAEELAVTRVIALLPKLDGSGHTESVWEVGKESYNPNGVKDLVKEIIFYNDPAFHIYVTYEKFGLEVVLNHLSFIEYARDREISSEEGGDREDQDPTGITKDSDQNSWEKCR